MGKLTETVEIVVHRTEPNFDRACDAARHKTARRFLSDDAACNAVIEFVSYTMTAGMDGMDCCYVFRAWIEGADSEAKKGEKDDL